MLLNLIFSLFFVCLNGNHNDTSIYIKSTELSTPNTTFYTSTNIIMTINNNNDTNIINIIDINKNENYGSKVSWKYGLIPLLFIIFGIIFCVVYNKLHLRILGKRYIPINEEISMQEMNKQQSNSHSIIINKNKSNNIKSKLKIKYNKRKPTNKFGELIVNDNEMSSESDNNNNIYNNMESDVEVVY